MTDRLTKADWIKHGLRTLASDGVGGLKVGPMSTKLKVSRGSFYWHFADIADFRSELLRSWRERTTDSVIQEIEAEAEPERLQHPLRRAFDPKLGVVRASMHDEWAAERAIRSWATEDAGVAVMVSSVDASRVGYISRLLVAAGVETRQAATRAAFLYWAYLGQAFVMDPVHAFISASAMDDIADLFET
jgi:AcrR family transcriptional regulator